MDISLAKIKLKYQDKIKNEFDIYYILASLEDKQEIKEFIEIYKNELILRYQHFSSYGKTSETSGTVCKILLEHLKEDSFYFNLFNLILDNMSIIENFKSENVMLTSEIHSLYEEMNNIKTNLDYILSHEYIYNARPYIMQIIEKKLNN